MSIKTLIHVLIIGCLGLAFSVNAEIYMWVDEHGKTHFSDRKPGADKDIKPVTISPAINTIPSIPTSDIQIEANVEQEKSKSKPQRTANRRAKDEPETDEYRCALAQAIVNKKVRLSNGNPTDKHTLEVAKRDIRKFCR